MSAFTGLHRYRFPIQDLQHLASLNHCSKRTLWIRPAVVCHPPKRMADTTVLPSLVLRRLAPVNTNCWQPRGQKPDRRLRFDQKLPRFTYRTSFHLCTSTSVAGDFWCRPSSPMAGTPYALFRCVLRPWTRESLGDFHGSPLLVTADAVASSCPGLRQNRFPVSRLLKARSPGPNRVRFPKQC